MIRTEYPFKGDKSLIRTYSDDPSCALLQLETGAVYAEAIDRVPCRYSYAETKKEEWLE